MAWFRFQKLNASSDGAKSSIKVAWGERGAMFTDATNDVGWLSERVDLGAEAELVLLLRQLADEGYIEVEGSTALLGWEAFYKLVAAEEYGASLELLAPPPRSQLRLALTSFGSLTDQDFAISSTWIDADGGRLRTEPTRLGALLESKGARSLISEAEWITVEGLRAFAQRPPEERSAQAHRMAWARIRRSAVSAGADLSDFLRQTIVLSPQKLRIGMRKGETGSRLVEIIPTFEEAPSRWLELFDRLSEVPDRYEVPDGAGMVHVVLSPAARAVLREIRKMPGRRVAGDRAEAFLRNPFATLGPDAALVIDAEQFEQSREEAGIAFTAFAARIDRDEHGFPFQCALRLEESLLGQVKTEILAFEGATELAAFVEKLERRISTQSQCCHWKGYDLEILGDSADQLEALKEALRDMQAGYAISASVILDLSKYSERIQGIGTEKPYYSPFIAKRSEEGGWFPDNVSYGLCYTPTGASETIAVVLDDDSMKDFRAALERAKAEGSQSFTFPGFPKDVEVEWAADALDSIGKVKAKVDNGAFENDKSFVKPVVERRGLVVKPNVEILDYEERRGALDASGASARLPASFRPGIELKEHQLEGLAWLQHLWSKSPAVCRGALLADDMGLGKTIQLLSFIAAELEANPALRPFLIVAPVSLLDNWKEEIEKFFAAGAMKVLTLYGGTLATLRVPKAALDASLVEAGATRLLRPGWLGSAKIVLTTYETLRDLEFSLAGQPWSAMICDEAQKIKNPNALVSRAAKKQNAQFKIACTGTPVENTLTDIWCLFDFVQPGLLGPLKYFGERYRSPIESEADDDDTQLGELRELIEPQKLRRMKADVAKDLPRKIESEPCRQLPISPTQRAHYADAIAAFRTRNAGPATGLHSSLGLLQYLRRLCSDPVAPGQLSSDSEPIEIVEKRSPKLAWLLSHLAEIQSADEKAIVFCEFRDLQRTLQRAIASRYGFQPDVINGDTSLDSKVGNSRQKRIRAFQERPGFGVIILSPLAVGFGVNIQAANHVIHFTRTWNPAKEDQATDRAYRIGQKRDVHVYYPVVVASDFETFDQKLDKLLKWKRSLSADMLRPSGDLSPSQFADLEAPDGQSAFGEELLTEDDLGTMGGKAFEAFCALMWHKQGYSKTIMTQSSGDGGVDVVAIKGGKGVLIQCKSSSETSKQLGWEAIKDVAAGCAAYSAKNPGVVFTLAAATNQTFNNTARYQAKLLNVELFERDDLAKLLARHPVKRGELTKFVYSSWGGHH